MVSDDRSLVLLLTATVDPGGTPLVARRDPLTRLRDYEGALSAWLTSDSVHKIVMYENSGYDLDSLRQIARRFPEHEVEFHSFSANQEGSARGKGYAELSSMLRAMQTSALIGAGDTVVKCTGRLMVQNARQLFASIRAMEQFDVMCTLKSHFTFADSRLFAATPAFIVQYLAPQLDIINDMEGVYLEHALACAAARAIADRKRWRPFPILPKIEGISGTLGVALDSGVFRRMLRPAYHRLRNVIYRR